MPRKRRKTAKDEVEHLFQKCRYCKAHRDVRFFDRHETACKTRWIIHNENQQHSMGMENPGAIQPQDQLEDFMRGSGKMQLDDNVVEEVDETLDMSLDSGVKEPNPSPSESNLC
jgi:hypothetical protein